MARTRSITSINNEIKKVEDELIKVYYKQEELEVQLLDFHNLKQEIDINHVIDVFNKCCKSIH